MKVLTADQMREVDRRTIELGIPGLVLMENAGHRVMELLEREFAPLSAQRVAVLCGKGNNGGDGLVIARQLFTRFRPVSLDVLLAADPGELKGDAAANWKMLEACGCPSAWQITPRMRMATLVIDALLGTGLAGPASGRMLELIREINAGFPLAKVVAVDIPSGLPGDSASPSGEAARADYTVTFTAPKIAHALPPNCDAMGKLVVGPIGSPPELMQAIALDLLEPSWFRPLLAPRARGAHKGDFGHVLVVGGAAGKTGAAAMTGMAALRAGAGLVTVACQDSNLAAVMPELMSESLPGYPESKDVIALGPGLGAAPDGVSLARRAFAEWPKPMVVDADGLNALAGTDFAPGPALRVLTPHPGEMGRLLGLSTAEVQADRLGAARRLAAERRVCAVLKGQRTLIAFPDGRVWINPTGTPAMASGGSGDILTGLIAGLLAQFPDLAELAVAAGVYLHGLAGELGVAEKGEKSLVATDLLRFLPAALNACARVSN